MEVEREEMPPERPPPTAEQMEHLVGRLDVAVREYLAIGASSSLRLNPPQIRTVLGWALQEATGKAYNVPAAQTEAEFFMAGLLEEITQIPSNTFEEVEFPDGTLRYVPLAADIWRQCLEIYRGRLGGDAAAERKGKIKAPKPRRR